MYGDDVYVAFCMDDGPHWWSWMLHPKIKHCYAVMPHRGEWYAFSRSTNGIELMLVENIYDVVDNDILVKSKVRKPTRGLFMLNTCVGYTKQILGINKPFIWTPYQLYRYLERQNEETKGT